MSRNARWAARTGLRALGIGTVATGVALGLVALPALTAPAGAEPTGTITLTPESGSITDAPFASFTASAPCPTGYDTLAQLTIEVNGSPIVLAVLEGAGLDESPPTGTVDGSLADTVANDAPDLPDGVFPLVLDCFDAEFNLAADPFRSAVRITGDAWQVVETADPTPTGTADPTPTGTPSPTPAPTGTASPTPTESPSPTPTDSPSPTPTDDPSPTPTDDPNPTPTETLTPVPDPGTGGGTLPRTGSDLFTYVYLGLVLVAAGAAALLWARRLGLLARDAPDASTP